MPKAGTQGQALAMRINGDKAAFYNCRFYGFQDTLCDDIGNHFFKDCYIEGTYDFIFGRGASLYLVSLNDYCIYLLTYNKCMSKTFNEYVFVYKSIRTRNCTLLETD